MKGRGFKRLASYAVSVSLLISSVRVFVLFCESYSRVSAERSADARLLQLCRDEESAAASEKFMSACIQARAAGASPILLKSLLRACETVVMDTVELFSSPTRVVVIVLLILSGVSAPLFRFLFLTLVAGLRTQKEEEEEEEEQRTIIKIDPFHEQEPLPWLHQKVRSGLLRVTKREAKLHDD